jgi:hypothetical protein
MTKTVSIRELSRNTGLLSEYDYVDIEDQKSHEYKGVFIPPHYAAEVKAFLEKKIRDEKTKKVARIMKFAGAASGDTQNLTAQEIKASKQKKYT